MKKLFSSTVIYTIAPQLPRLVSLFMLPVLTPYLTDYDYGVNGIVLAYLGSIQAFSDLGLQLIVANSFFQYPDGYKEIWRKIYGFLTIWSLIYGLMLVPIIIAGLPKQEVARLPVILAVLLLPVMFCDTTNYFALSHLQLNQKPLAVTAISVTSGLLAIVINYVAIVIFRQGYLGFFLSMAFTKLYSFTICFYLMIIRWKIRPDYRFSFSQIKGYLSKSIPTIPHYYSGYLLNMSDRLLLNFFQVPVGIIGLYSFGYTFGSYFSILGKGLAQAGTPIFLGLYKEDRIESDLQVRNMLFVAQVVLLAAGFIASLWLKEIVELLARNASLKDAYIYGIPVLMAYTYSPIYFGAISRLRYSEKTNVFWKISLIAALINIGLNLILIPFMGILGAALTTFISYMYMAYSGYFVKEFRQINRVNYHEKVWFVVMVALTGLAFGLKDAPVVVKLFVTVLSGVGSVWGLCILNIPSVNAFFSGIARKIIRSS